MTARVALVLGVDGGNTKTLALVAHGDGQVVGRGRAGCSDIYSTPSVAAAVAEIRTAVHAALADAGAAPEALDAAVYSLAGADWPEDIAELRQALTASLGVRGPIEVVNDAIGCVRGGCAGGVGVAVSLGTGFNVGAIGPDGRVWHSSFWAEPSGAIQLGLDALRRVCRAELGLDPPTSLRDRVLRQYGHKRFDDLLRAFTRRGGLPTLAAAQLAEAVLDEAAAGDAAAGQIVATHAALAVDYATVAAAKVGLNPADTDLVVTGGVFRHRARLLGDRIAAISPFRAVRPALHEPAMGAVLLALDAAGLPAPGGGGTAHLPCRAID
jgi:N-acetylglucosamine kinase-like BadF-type ATPase